MLRVEPFYMKRHNDITGISGEGIIAVGAVFPTGEIVVNWLSATPTLEIVRSLAHLEHIHGHNGNTEIIMGYPKEPKKKRRKKNESN